MLVAVLTTASPVEESAVVASVLVRQSGSLKSTVHQRSNPIRAQASAIAAHRRRSQQQFVIIALVFIFQYSSRKVHVERRERRGQGSSVPLIASNRL